MTSPGDDGGLVLRGAEGAADMETVRQLFVEYQDAIGVDLCFQGFEEEVATLPGRYQPPAGCLLLALDGEEAAGVVGMWPLAREGVCEMKRLYVRPSWRGRGLGRRLAGAAVEAGRATGYRSICLDTLDFMTEARTLYRAMGFAEIPAYYDNPLPGVVYMERNFEQAPFRGPNRPKSANSCCEA